MAKKAYIGVDGVARKVKKGYVGVPTEFPVYDGDLITTHITDSNLTTLFTVSNGTYYFSGSGSTFTSTNKGKDDKSATSTWTATVDMASVSFDYAVSSESNYDKLTIVVAGSTIANNISGEKNGTWTGSLASGQSIQMTYSKDYSSASGSDTATVSNVVVIQDKRQIVGTETRSVARKIKKAYIGVGGVARPCWAGGIPVYYGQIESLDGALSLATGASIGDWAVFFGGAYSGDNYHAGYNCYDSSLTRTYKQFAWKKYYSQASASNAKYAMFAGGGWAEEDGGGTDHNTKTVFTIDDALTNGYFSSSNLSAHYGSGLSGARAGKYVVFAGNVSGNDATAIDDTRTEVFPGYLNERRGACGTTTINDCAVFAGGEYNDADDSPYDTVDVYDTNLTRTVAGRLSSRRSSLNGNTLGKFAIFSDISRGYTSKQSVVDVLDDTYTIVFTGNMIEPRQGVKSMEAGDYVMFIGGNNGEYPYPSVKTVTLMDDSLVQTIGEPLQTGRQSHSVASNSRYVIVAGGNYNSNSSAKYTETVEAYMIS